MGRAWFSRGLHGMKYLFPVLVGCVVLSGCTRDAVQAELNERSGIPVAFERVASVTLSPVDTPTYRIIVDQDSWTTAWSELVAGRWPPAPPAPSIDFESRVVLFVGAGSLPTQLLSFGVVDVRLRNGVVKVTVREEWPGSQCGSLPVTTRPVDIVTIPRLSSETEFLTERTSRC
jgi:hypothetical protein